MTEHPESRVPLRLNDDELIQIGAYVRGHITNPTAQAQALATVGAKLTKFFVDVTKTAVEHYDRENPVTDEVDKFFEWAKHTPWSPQQFAEATMRFVTSGIAPELLARVVEDAATVDERTEAGDLLHRSGDEIDGTVYCTCGEGDYGTVGHGGNGPASDAQEADAWCPGCGARVPVERIRDYGSCADCIGTTDDPWSPEAYRPPAAEAVARLIERFADWRVEYGPPVAEEVAVMRATARMMRGNVDSLPSFRWNEAFDAYRAVFKDMA